MERLILSHVPNNNHVFRTGLEKHTWFCTKEVELCMSSLSPDQFPGPVPLRSPEQGSLVCRARERLTLSLAVVFPLCTVDVICHFLDYFPGEGLTLSRAPVHGWFPESYPPSPAQICEVLYPGVELALAGYHHSIQSGVMTSVYSRLTQLFALRVRLRPFPCMPCRSADNDPKHIQHLSSLR